MGCAPGWSGILLKKQKIHTILLWPCVATGHGPSLQLDHDFAFLKDIAEHRNLAPKKNRYSHAEFILASVNEKMQIPRYYNRAEISF